MPFSRTKTVGVIVNGESRLPGGLFVVTKDNFAASKEQMVKDRSNCPRPPGPRVGAWTPLSIVAALSDSA